jgi:N6-adenosine-specific RNA methylase IME4
MNSRGTDLIIARMEPACRMLAEARDAQQARKVVSLAEAAEVYARKEKLGNEAVEYAMGIKAEALALMGDFLKQTPTNNGARGVGKSGVPPKNPTRAEMGCPDKKVNAAAVTVSDMKEKEPELFAKLAKGKSKPSAAIKQYKKKVAVEQIKVEPPPLPSGPFRVIVIDPPWHYEKRAGDPTHRADLPYPSMTLDAIKALDVASLAHTDSVLWLWTTNAHLSEAFGIAAAWGFTYKTLLTWVKDRMGTGDWLRGQTEHCLLCVRGKPVVNLTNQTTVLNGPLRNHSQKPEEFYTLVEALCPGSKVELFARAKREGWSQHGNELAKDTPA